MSISDIKEGAIFIADAHYPHHGDEFIEILKKIETKEIQTPQLFLMGDIFDLLFGYNEYIKSFSSQAILLLQNISKTIEIHYIEGNHDFCLKDIFPDIKIYDRERQPIEFRLGEQSVYLSHGDLYETGFGYNFYSKLLRNKISLYILKPFERFIIDYQISKLKQKDICHDFKSFETRAEAIIRHYPLDVLIIEGHFHQAKQFKNYISLPSLACQKQIGVVVNQKLVFEDVTL